MASKLVQIASILQSRRLLRNSAIAKSWSVQWNRFMEPEETEDEASYDEDIMFSGLTSAESESLPPIARSEAVQQRMEFARHHIRNSSNNDNNNGSVDSSMQAPNHNTSWGTANPTETRTATPLSSEDSYVYLAQ